MKKYSKANKQKWNRQFWMKKRRAGWKFFGFCLPSKIGEELQSLKRQRMDEYRKSQMPGKVETP